MGWFFLVVVGGAAGLAYLVRKKDDEGWFDLGDGRRDDREQTRKSSSAFNWPGPG